MRARFAIVAMTTAVACSQSPEAAAPPEAKTVKSPPAGSSPQGDIEADPRQSEAGNAQRPTTTGESIATTGPVTSSPPAADPHASRLDFTSEGQCSGATCPDDCFDAGRPRLGHAIFDYKIAYARSRDSMVHLRAFVSYPPGFDPAAPAPAIAFFHGGGLTEGKPIAWMPATFYFASRGYVAVTFQYRITSLHGSVPAESVADAKSAMRWLRKNAAALGVAPDAIVAVGESAGGLLAIDTALNGSANDERGDDAAISSAPALVAALYPMLDASLGGFPADLSPTALLAAGRMPPMILLQGDADTLPVTPPAVASAFCAAQGGGCVYVNFPAQNHGFIALTEQHQRALTLIDTHLVNARIGGGDIAAIPAIVKAAKPHCQMTGANLQTLDAQYGFANGGGIW